MIEGQNKDEIFDIVDDCDNVIGSAPRSKIHAEKLRHRSVHAIVFDKSGKKILMQKRSFWKDSHPGAYTTSCSGHVDSTEDYDKALIRETYEELGIITEISDFKKIGKIEPSKSTGQEFTFVYTLVCEGPFKFPENEIHSLEWILEDDFERLIAINPKLFTPSFIRVYKFFRREVPREKQS